MQYKSYITILAMLLAAQVAKAQFVIQGEIRPRAEFRQGFKSLHVPDTDAAFFVEQRSRISFSYTDEKMLFRLSLQDVRLWGENSQIYKADNSLSNVNEAWGQYNFTGRSAVKLGRQEVNYDNARMLGNLAWAQQSRSHDMFLYKYVAPSGFQWHIGAAFNQEDVNANAEPARLRSTFYSGVNNYKTMQYSWMNKKYEAGTFSFLALNNGLQAADSSVHFSQTVGFYTNNNLGKSMTLTAEGYYQMGKDAAGRDLSAYLGSLVLGWKLGSHKLDIGGDILSGTDPGSDTNGAFNPLFGTNHKFYGFMDYFYVGNPHNNVGLVDLNLKTTFKTGEKSSLMLHLHYFNAQADIIAADNSTASSYLGTEADLVYNNNLAKGVNLKVGFSYMAAGDSMELIKSGSKDELNIWGWTMLTVKPVLFKK